MCYKLALEKALASFATRTMDSSEGKKGVLQGFAQIGFRGYIIWD